MSRRKGLGRGLEALIPVADEQEGAIRVAVTAITPNPMQPRTTLHPEALAELAASIREHGLIQPLIVTQQGPERYQIIAGERRWQAARMAGLATVPVIVKEATAQQSLEMALVENIQRADLNPLEEASAFRHLVDEFGLTQEQVAERVGKSRVAVTNTLRLLRLPVEVKQALADGTIREGHARALMGLPNRDAQIAALSTVMNKALSVRQTEELVRRTLAPPEQKGRRPSVSPDVQALEDKFRETLGTKVSLHRNRQGRGRLVIYFYAEEELQAIYDAIVGD